MVQMSSIVWKLTSNCRQLSAKYKYEVSITTFIQINMKNKFTIFKMFPMERFKWVQLAENWCQIVDNFPTVTTSYCLFHNILLSWLLFDDLAWADPTWFSLSDVLSWLKMTWLIQLMTQPALTWPDFSWPDLTSLSDDVFWPDWLDLMTWPDFSFWSHYLAWPDLIFLYNDLTWPDLTYKTALESALRFVAFNSLKLSCSTIKFVDLALHGFNMGRLSSFFNLKGLKLVFTCLY